MEHLKSKTMKLKLDYVIIFTFLFVGQINFAQVSKNVIVEHFTNSRCSICATSSKNPAFYTNLAGHPDVLHISYHPSSPYPNCVFSQHNPTENDGRTNYYNIYGSTPKLVVQGIQTPANVGFNSADVFSQHLNQTSEVSISIVQTKITDQTIEVMITMTTEVAHNYTDVKLLVGVAEKLVNYDAPNGEQEHHDVFREAMTDIEGDAVTLPAVGESITMTYSVANNADWDFNQMFAYAILNEGITREVIQSQAASPSDNTTSTTEVNTFKNLKIYPNPVNDLLNIDLERGEDSSAKIFDSFGKLLLEKTFDFQTQIDFSNFAQGLYFLEIKNKEGKAVKKLIK